MNESKALNPAPPSTGIPAPQPSLGAILWIAWFSVREMVRRRRLLALALINLLPLEHHAGGDLCGVQHRLERDAAREAHGLHAGDEAGGDVCIAGR